MKRFLPILPGLLSLLIGITSLLYFWEIFQGMKKHSPISAPITYSTVILIFLLSGTGLVIGAISTYRSRKWLSLAAFGLCLNLLAILIWTYWTTTAKLLPYEEWTNKMGMP